MAEIQIDPIIAAVYGQPPPDLDLDADNYFIYNIVAIVFFVLAVISVVLRVYVRMTRGARLAMDDYTIVGAIFTAGATLFMTIYAANFGSGRHIWAVDPTEFIIVLKQMVYAEPWIYATAVTVTRASILLLYHRLFDTNTTSNTIYIWQTRFAVGLTAAYPFVMYIVMAVACRPLSYYWTQYLGQGEGTCIDVLNFYLAFGVLNLINDVVILALPIPTIAKLHMDWRKKLSIMGIMLLGAFSCVSSLIRIFYLSRLASSIDVTWWFGPGMGWSCIEPSTAIITACLPTLAPLFRKNKPATGGSSNNYYRSADGGTKATRRGDVCAAERGQQEWDKIDDDEIELTGNQRMRASSYSPSGKMDDDMVHSDGGITVETQVDVSSSHSQVSGKVWKDKSDW
ncbi:hypothetical protein PG993_012738 [Apiospora rasikravindrae]|uniref:Rhodopsin domain-containing protein n=1 Tax=Apiospora rasikravindrae TaxID=990691 RepID=A0ABR1RVM9_9PEZI